MGWQSVQNRAAPARHQFLSILRCGAVRHGCDTNATRKRPIGRHQAAGHHLTAASTLALMSDDESGRKISASRPNGGYLS